MQTNQQRRVKAILVKDFDNSQQAIQLSQTLGNVDPILTALGIAKGDLQKYCRIVIGLAKGKSRFNCSDQTVGARYFYGDKWKALSERDRIRCTNRGSRLNSALCKIRPNLIIRHSVRGKSTQLEVQLLNIVLRTTELMKLGYSASEAVKLLRLPITASASSGGARTRSIYTKLKLVKTLIEQIRKEDPKLLEEELSKPPVLIHECPNGNTPDYKKMGITGYTLALKDDQTGALTPLAYSDLDRAISEAKDKEKSLILKHSAENIIQLDDCDVATAFQLQRICFEIVETSPGNFHCRMALPIGTRERARLSVRDRLVRHPNLSCNGGGGKSFRVPGSINFKPGRNNHEIKRLSAQEHFTSIAELSLAGLIPYEHRATRAEIRTAVRMPDYSQIKTYKDSSASAKDFRYARMAAGWGRSRKRIIEGLRKDSPTAAKKGEKYIERTVNRAIGSSKRWKSTEEVSPPQSEHEAWLLSVI